MSGVRPRAQLPRAVRDAFANGANIESDHDFRVETLVLSAKLALGLAHYAEAKTLLELAVDISERRLGKDADKSLERQALLALVLQRMGDIKAARPLVERIHERRVAKLGRDAEDSLESESLLAMVLLDAGDTVAAIELLAHTFSIRSKTRDPNDEMTLLAKFNYGHALVNQGAFADGRLLLEQVLETTKSAPGDHVIVETGASVALAFALSQLGALPEALALLKPAASVSEISLGLTHPMTLEAMRLLAELYLAHADPWKAREVLESLLPIQRNTLGSTHRGVLHSMQTLARTLCLLLDEQLLEDALQLQENCLQLRLDVFGEAHPETCTAMMDMAATLYYQSKYSDARALQQRALRVRSQLLGEHHVSVLSTVSGILLIAQEEQDMRAMVDLSLRLLRLIEHTLGDSDEVFSIACQAAEVLLNTFRGGTLKSSDHPDLFELLERSGIRLQAMLEMRDFVTVGHARNDYLKFNRYWLALSMCLAPSHCMAALRALNGIEAWSCVLGELLTAAPAERTTSEQREFLDARRELSAARAKLVPIQARMLELLGPQVGIRHPFIQSGLTWDTQREQLRKEQEDCLRAERRALRNYDHAKARLAACDPTFAAAALRPNGTEWHRMLNLQADEALAILFEVERNLFCAIQRPGMDAEVVALPELQQWHDRVRRRFWNLDKRGAGATMRGLQGAAAMSAPHAEERAWTFAKTIEEAAEFLWQPLRQLAPLVRHWCIVTGPGTHDIPGTSGQRRRAIHALLRLAVAATYSSSTRGAIASRSAGRVDHGHR